MTYFFFKLNIGIHLRIYKPFRVLKCSQVAYLKLKYEIIPTRFSR